ncbi:hypothetical protein ACHAWF_007755 [Thalassiosira exigua]
METKLSSYKREKEQALDDIEELRERLSEAEEAAASAEAATEEKERAVSGMAEAEARHEEVVSGLRAQASASASQVSKLIDQLSVLSGEKTTVAAKLEATASELSATKEEAAARSDEVARLESSIESIGAARDAACARATELLADGKSAEEESNSLRSERDALASGAAEAEEAVVRLEAEKAEAVAEARRLEGAVGELEGEAERLTADLDASKAEIDDLKARMEAASSQPTAEAGDVPSDSLDNPEEGVDVRSRAHYETKIQSLQSEIDELKDAKLAAEKIAVDARNAPALPQSQAAGSADDLRKDLAEANGAFERAERDHRAELQKLKDELRDTKDNNVVLEEAVQDIQVEKEDLELENEELATKLTDLTTQAKKMLLNNESLEEALQDQMIEYEDRIAELESELAPNDGDEESSLLQKHQAALETIAKLQEDAEQGNSDNDSQSTLKRLEEENDALREAVDHLSSENEAAKEIEIIVLELRAKNMEMSETLHELQEQNEAAVKTIEELKADNEQLRNALATTRPTPPEDRVVPFEHVSDETRQISDLESELHYYKSLVQMKGTRNSANGQPVVPSHGSPNDWAMIALDSPGSRDDATNERAIVPVSDANETGSYAPPQTDLHPVGEVEEQMRTLTIENGQLAQRLGGAVAEKEFAMTTLTKLGAKMEELIERNKLLSEIADLKSQQSGGGSAKRHRELKLRRPKGRGLDPDASSEAEKSSAYSYYDQKRSPDYPAQPSVEDDPSAYSDVGSFMGSTILSYEPTKKLEPESSSCLGGIAEEDGMESIISSRRDEYEEQVDDTDKSLEKPSEPRLVKVNGGEYFGSFNKRGQKHGEGTMKYDNGNEYSGQWKDNKRDGKGTTKYKSGNVYTGIWKTGKRHGFGVFHIQKTGDVYRGNWAQGLKSGPGVYEYADGELDVSFYQDDIRVGEGVRWSASRHQASRLMDGQLVGEEGEMPVDDAMKLTKHLGFVV